MDFSINAVTRRQLFHGVTAVIERGGIDGRIAELRRHAGLAGSLCPITMPVRVGHGVDVGSTLTDF